MYVVKIAGVIASGHSKEADALTQKQIFIDSGVDAATITIEQQ